jgi:tRNA-specific 2-thiouridylase
MNDRLHRIVVGLSGGVDSAVAALLLKEQGHEVVGVFMKNWEDDDTDEHCTSRQDLVDAASVADVIGIDIEAVNFAAEYRDRVFAHFLSEYGAGRTPNPDVLCNSEIKFKAFLDHALSMGADAIATGHYARVECEGARVRLCKALDGSKDQTYFLHRLTQAQLQPAMFPVGELHKRTVRAIAREKHIPVHAKKDSTVICFIGERPFREFLSRYLAHTPGPMVASDGRTVGQHQGLAFYTLGQRTGLGIGGVSGGGDGAWFVAAKDRDSNTLRVVQGRDDASLWRSEVTVSNMHWIADAPPARSAVLRAKTRYRMADAYCRLEPLAQGRWRVTFESPQWAPTPGQYLVLYEGDTCLGGGVIEPVPSVAEAAPRQVAAEIS